MKPPLIVVLSTLLLGSCNITQTTTSGMSVEQQTMFDYLVSQGMEKNKATLVAVSPVARQIYFDDQKCLGYGAKPGSDAYVTCRAQLDAGHNQAQATAAAIGAQSGGGGDYYPSAIPASDAPPLRNIIPPTTRCQSVNAGLGTVQTVCR